MPGWVVFAVCFHVRTCTYHLLVAKPLTSDVTMYSKKKLKFWSFSTLFSRINVKVQTDKTQNKQTYKINKLVSGYTHLVIQYYMIIRIMKWVSKTLSNFKEGIDVADERGRKDERYQKVSFISISFYATFWTGVFQL